MSVVRPKKALHVADGVPVGIAQLAEDIGQSLRIQLELALQGAIGDPAPLAQQGNHPLYECHKVHPVRSLLSPVPVEAWGTLS